MGSASHKYSPVNKERLYTNFFAKYAPRLKVNGRRNVTRQHYCVKDETQNSGKISNERFSNGIKENTNIFGFNYRHIGQ